jgi:antitoxin (DNA-binding transcriptional repressor) of toxin-antitoxin stability system
MRDKLSRLVEAMELGNEREIAIARNGGPVAKLVPLEARESGYRIGVAKNIFEIPGSIDKHNDEVARLYFLHAPS